MLSCNISGLLLDVGDLVQTCMLMLEVVEGFEMQIEKLKEENEGMRIRLNAGRDELV